LSPRSILAFSSFRVISDIAATMIHLLLWREDVVLLAFRTGMQSSSLEVFFAIAVPKWRWSGVVAMG